MSMYAACYQQFVQALAEVVVVVVVVEMTGHWCSAQ